MTVVRSTYPAALDARFLRPPAPQLEEALAVARERIPALEYEPSQDGPVLRMPRAYRKHRARELWETFVTRGLLPESWFEDPRRGFTAGFESNARGSPTSSLRWKQVVPDEVRAAPQDVLHAVLFASNPRGAETAEALVYELSRRLLAWGAPPVEGVVWCTMRSSVLRSMQRDGNPQQPLDYVYTAAWKAAGDSMLELGRSGLSTYEQAREALDRVCRAGLRVPAPPPGTDWWPASLAGAAFAALPDPLAPWIELVAQGYYFAGYTEKAAVLLAGSTS